MSLHVPPRSAISFSRYVPAGWMREWLLLAEPHVALQRVWCNVTTHDGLTGLADAPFHLDV